MFAALVCTAAWSQAQPSVVGQWTGVLPWPDNSTHAILLPTGKVLTWNEFSVRELHLWDPDTHARSLAAFPGYNPFCAGHALMADGRMLLTGGHIDSNQGLPHASIYDAFTDSWTRLPDMNAGRWYPTNTNLANGEMLVIAGTDTARRVGENRLPQVWQPALNAWRDLTGAQRTLRTYPWMFVAPNGKVFMAGPDPVTGYLDTEGSGAWDVFAPSRFGDRFAGSAVMYDEGKVMVCGGGEDVPTATVEVIDLNSPAPAWRSVQPMAQLRKQHNATLLPDGTVLVFGGSSGPGKSDDTHPVLTTELWDPAAERFSLLAPSTQFRGYHSNALLLPDGRVLSMGGESTLNVEIFSPPYLFKGPRPAITEAPSRVGYGETFTVRTPHAASITKVTWLAPGSTTHAFNQGQRINRLAFTREAGALRVTAPMRSALAPPGLYLLFLLDDKGVPSVAHWVKVEGPDRVPPPEVLGVSFGEVWKYDDRGDDPGPSWDSARFDDSLWRTGRSAFATGGVAAETLLEPREDRASVYFRKKLLLRGTAAGGRLEIRHGDGVAVWINGTRVLARNVDAGTGHTTPATASAPQEGLVSTALIPSGVLVEGENQIAAVVKRVNPTEATPSSALRFDLALWVSTSGQVEPVPLLWLSSPNGGEALEAGSELRIAWTTHGTLPEVKLEYSADGGGGWQTFEPALPNSGHHSWRLPALESTRVLVRISAAAGSASADVSDAPFTISGGRGCGSCAGNTPRRDDTEAGGCTTSGSRSAALGPLLALAWALHRRRARAADR